MRRVLLVVAMFLTTGLLGMVSSAAVSKDVEGTPTRAIQDLDAKLEEYRTGPNLSEADKEHNKRLKKDILHGTFDVKELSRLSLDAHWFPLTYKDRQAFVDLMTELLENKAILSKEQGQKKSKSAQVYQVRYLGDIFLNKNKSRAVSKSTVYVKSEDISVKLNYKLRKKDKEWKIYDVIMDGASLVDNYKYQFDRIIVKNGYPELVSRMKKKLKEIQEDSEEEGLNN